MGALGGINELDPLPSDPLDDDIVLIARSNVVHSTALVNVPNRLTARKQIVAPTLADFSTWVNQQSGEVADIPDGIRCHIAAPFTDNNIHCRVRSLPGGSWDVMLGMCRGFPNQGAHIGGLVLRESSTGKLQTFSPSGAGATEVNSWTSPTVFAGQAATRSEESAFICWLRALKSGTNIVYNMSYDGVSWMDFFTTPLTTPFTTAPNQWGFFSGASGLAIDNQIDIIDWDE